MARLNNRNITERSRKSCRTSLSPLQPKSSLPQQPTKLGRDRQQKKSCQFQEQLELYKSTLISNHEAQLSTTQEKSSANIESLINNFNVKCSVLENVANLLTTEIEDVDYIAIEEGQETTVKFGERIQSFEKALQEKTKSMNDDWNLLVGIQDQILTLCLEIFGPEAVDIKHQDPRYQEMIKDSEETHRAYVDGFRNVDVELNQFQNEVKAMTADTLTANEEILQTFNRQHSIKMKAIKQTIVGQLG